MTVGRRLKQLRLSESKTQTNVANMQHVTKSTVSMYERDDRIPIQMY